MVLHKPHCQHLDTKMAAPTVLKMSCFAGFERKLCRALTVPLTMQMKCFTHVASMLDCSCEGQICIFAALIGSKDAHELISMCWHKTHVCCISLMAHLR